MVKYCMTESESTERKLSELRKYSQELVAELLRVYTDIQNKETK